MCKKFIIRFAILSALIFVAGNIDADINAQQANLLQTDLRNINVDELSDSQVRQFIREADSRGLSMQDLEAQAISRGMPYSEVQKLRQRISGLQHQRDVDMADEPERTVAEDAILSERELQRQLVSPEELQIFGYELFRRENLTFEPSLNIPTPPGYQLGSGDELIIEVWGASQRSYQLTVNPEGQIRIDNIGPVHVSGLTIERASELIISRLTTIYSGLRGPSPNTFAQVSLGSVRSIKVTIAGDAFMPGTYTLPAFATAFNALYLAGGPAQKGSFREIRVIRNGETVTNIDLYDFLLRGETSLNIRLRDEDLIFIGPYRNRTTIAGQVKRPAIYELRESETLSDLIDYSGGFTASAYKKRLQVDRKTESQRQLLNVETDLYSSFLMRNGDIIRVGPILERYDNRVVIEGAVFREGEYALTEGMTVTELISRAEGLREDAFLNRAALYRLRDNLETEIIELNISHIIDGAVPDIPLQREDILMISSVFDLQQERTVRVVGEVNSPGSFPYAHNIQLGEIIRKAGGLTDAASLAIVEVARRTSDRTTTSPVRRISEIFTFPIDGQLSLDDEASSFTLEPFDLIFVRRSPGYTPQITTEVRGEVVFPGRYAITSKNERISDLIKRSGGLTEDAYIPGATLIRQANGEQTARIRQLEALETDEVEILDETFEEEEQRIGIDLERILRNPYSIHDLILMEGDILSIPQEFQTVRLTGSLLHPVTTPYRERMGVRGYVANAGGFADNAMKRKVYVLYPNGSVDRTRNFLLFRSYPMVEPGSEIIVPQKPERQPRTLQETLAIGSAMTSLALVIVTLINQF
ncbi:MAG: capsule biosynthesis protein [Marinilabiliales bacterium]|nr:MAG: capsule biosynthesis protein [Marinilabiliales bacterium]